MEENIQILQETARSNLDVIKALNLSSIISITDPTGKIIYVNDKFCEISKFARSELLGENHRIINPHFHPPSFFSHMWHEISSGRVWKGEVKDRAKDGTYYWVFTTIVPFMHDDGSPRLYVSIRTEITDLKREQEKQKNIILELEKSKLEQNIREEVISILSHDLKTPLAAVKMSLELMLKKACEPDFVRKLSEKAITSVERVDEMINQFLDENKKKYASEQNNSKVLGDLSVMIQETYAELFTIYGDRISLKVNGNLSGVWDQPSIQRMLENLCNNAAKYGEEKGLISIQVRGDAHIVQISVHNIGNPLSEQDQSNIFGYLCRSQSAVSSDKKGWGMGLALVKRIADIHGGNVTVRSSASEGNTFLVSLPKGDLGQC